MCVPGGGDLLGAMHRYILIMVNCQLKCELSQERQNISATVLRGRPLMLEGYHLGSTAGCGRTMAGEGTRLCTLSLLSLPYSGAVSPTLSCLSPPLSLSDHKYTLYIS